MALRSAWTVRAGAWTHLRRAAVAQSQIRGGLPQCLCDSGRSQGRHWLLAGLLQRGAPASEPGLSHPAANLPARPVDMWTIGVADRLRFPRFPSELGRRGNAHLRPHTHRHYSQQAIHIDASKSGGVASATAPTMIGADIETGGATP